MNAAERDFIQRGWDEMSNESIAKDVATKGKYINLAISYLAKRLEVQTIQEAKTFFRIEVNKYVERLLLNKQVFKAEHVLSNVNINPKFYFYEFYENCDNSEVRCSIVNYLKKTLADAYDREHQQIIVELKALKMVQSDEKLRSKYPKVHALEQFKELDAKTQKELLADVCFSFKCKLIIEELDKHITWSYLLDHQLSALLCSWIQSIGESSENLARLDVTFENVLKKKFSAWDIDSEMIDQIKLPKYKLPDYLLDCLAKRSIFMKHEEDNTELLVKRLLSSESVIEHREMLSSRPHSIEIIKRILDRKLIPFLIEECINVTDLIDVAPLYPHDKDELDLCIGLKQIPQSDLATMSTKTMEYLMKKDPQKDYSLVKLMNTLLQDKSNAEIPLPSDFKDIPILAAIFQKFRSSAGLNDFTVTLQDLVRRFVGVDLDSIGLDAGEEGLNFSNELLFKKYCHGRTSKLNYIYYVKQCRSSYAVYEFLIEQLSSFSKITDQQIMCACKTVSELAINNLENDEVVTHCFAFMEMLDVNTMHLRAYVKCLKLIKGCSDTISSEGESLTTSLLERVMLVKLKRDELSICDLHAARMVFELKKEKLPTSFLLHIAETKGWFQMIVFATYFNYSLEQVILVCDQAFHGTNLGMNLKRALRWEPIPDKTKRRNSLTYREKRKALNKNEIMVTSGDTMSSSISSTETIEKLKHSSSKFIADEKDLFAVIIQSVVDVSPVGSELLSYDKFLELLKNPRQMQSTTHLNLLRNAIDSQRPILSVLAALSSQFNVQYCWATWMITAMDSYQLPKESSDIQELSRALIEFSVINGFSRTLHHGMATFFPDSNFNMFTEYLLKTKLLDFSTDTTDLLERYFQELSNNDVELICLNNDNHQILDFSVVLLVNHLQFGFESKEYQRLMLASLCQSGIDFNDIIDFCFVSSINEILTFTDVEMDISSFIKGRRSDDEMKREYERICEQLVVNHEFSKAMTAADLFNLPKDNIIYESWIWNYEMDDTSDLDRYDRESDEYSLAPDIVINFYIHVASDLDYDNPKKYKILKKILDVIKRHHLFPNEGFDRDRIEYEMVLSFLRSPLTIDDIELYYSEYFETIMSKERFVLYKSFLDLKEMAGIEQLTVGNKTPLGDAEIEKLNSIMNRLLDDGDIVQALRLQSMFNHRPLDLHYLVFCMALAEGLASLYDLSVEQRKMLSDGVKLASSKFNRRTLTSTRLSQTSSSPSSLRPPALDSSDSSTTNDFEEIPSRERQDVLEALQSLAARINHGTKIGHRIAMTSQAAMYLDKEYVDVLKIKDPYLLLQSAIDEDCLNKLVVMNDIMTSMEMTHAEIADFLAEKITISIIVSRFYLLQSPPPIKVPIGQCLLWGYDLDKEFRLFLELCPNTSMLGNAILQYCDALKLYRRIDLKELADADIDQDTEFFDGVNSILEKIRATIGRKGLSHKKQNTINVELLIKAHECFVHECYMEGIAIVLQRTKQLNSVLTKAKSWNLIVKMLTGIGRYRDMYYCFETLIKNEQFESLLGQFDDDKSNGLKQAIISYLNENCPDATDYYRLAAVHFSIYKELSQMSENNAKSIVAEVITLHEQKNDDTNIRSQDEASITYLKCDPVITASLTIAMDEYANSAENYLFDNKLSLAQRAAYNAELIALQIDLNNREGERCICVLNIQSENVFRWIVNNNLSVPQSEILGHAYPYEINWTEAIFNQYILLSNEKFLVDFCDRHSITDEMIENLVKNFQIQTNITAKMEQHISNLVEMVESVTMRYRLASLLGLKRLIAQLINENSLFYLKDTNYGRNEPGN
ncbi:spatacsin [Bradysia coprophila]|uniref:spatacsin n=1 Tax=Bradysia coprophila TaxID=38358 RepID=UPI00187D77A4|nr:spatacsin [Bradysia coprophila]